MQINKKLFTSILFFTIMHQAFTQTIPYGNNKQVGKYATVNGIQLYYEVYGKGEPLLMLHGNGGSIEAFSKTIPYFAKKYKVIAVDSRSQGKSKDTKDSISFEMMADDFAVLLDQLGVDSANVLGWSDGGIDALMMALRHPDKTKKIALTGANIFVDSTVFGKGDYEGMMQYYKDSLPKTFANDKQKNDWKLFMLDLFQPTLSFKDLKSIKCPAFVICGDKDVISLEHTIGIYQHIPKAWLWVVPNSSHSTLIDHADEFNKKVDAFFTTTFH